MAWFCVIQSAIAVKGAGSVFQGELLGMHMGTEIAEDLAQMHQPAK